MSKPQSEFVGFLLDQLEPLGPVRARRMFGGYGIFMDQLMFALVADDTLFLKVDAGNRPAFDALNLPPFTYQRQGKVCALSYFQLPEEALEDGELLRRWAAQAYEAALRSAAAQ